MPRKTKEPEKIVFLNRYCKVIYAHGMYILTSHTEKYPQQNCRDLVEVSQKTNIPVRELSDYSLHTLYKSWSVDEVKRMLPDVTVRDGKKIIHAEVRGRELPFPVVVWGDRMQYKAEVAWGTLANCLNESRPVIV